MDGEKRIPYALPCLSTKRTMSMLYESKEDKRSHKSPASTLHLMTLPKAFPNQAHTHPLHFLKIYYPPFLRSIIFFIKQTPD